PGGIELDPGRVRRSAHNEVTASGGELASRHVSAAVAGAADVPPTVDGEDDRGAVTVVDAERRGVGVVAEPVDGGRVRRAGVARDSNLHVGVGPDVELEGSVR